MTKTSEHIFGCLTVRITVHDGMTIRLVPVCSVDLEPTIPDGVLTTTDGRPIMTADGYWLVVTKQE